MALYDWTADADTVVNEIQVVGESGDSTYVIDGNLSTYWRGSGSGQGIIEGRIEFEKDVKLSQVYVKAAASGSGSDSGTSGASTLIKLQDSSYNDIATIVDESDSGGANTTSNADFDDTVTGDWEDVRYIYFAVEGHGGGIQGGGGSGTLYEVIAKGIKYSDKGLWAYLATLVKAIGVEDLESQPLRVRIDDTTYAIPLLDTSDDDAGAIRIYGSATKAIPIIDTELS